MSIGEEAIRARVPEFIHRIARTLNSNGHSCYLVGGSIRDILSGRVSVDHDLTTDALPSEVQAIFPKTIPTGLRFGTVTVLMEGNPVEVTTFRLESDYLDRRHPESITFARTIEEDLSRRDLTINAIAMDLISGKIADPFGGREDLRLKRLRAVGDPMERLREDPLRIVRVFRFLSFGEIDTELGSAIRVCAPMLDDISVERIMTEFNKALAMPTTEEFFTGMHRYGALRVIIPRLYKDEVDTSSHEPRWPPSRIPKPSPDERVEWACKLVHLCSDREPMVKLAALFCALVPADPQEISGIMKDLRFSTNNIKEATSIFALAGEVDGLTGPEDVRWFIHRSGKELQGAVALWLAVNGSSLSGGPPSPMMERARMILTTRVPEDAPLVTGADIMEWLGIRTGRRVGQIKKELHKAQVMQGIRERTTMIKMLKEMYPRDVTDTTDQC